MNTRSSAKNRSSRRAASKGRLEFRPRPDKQWLLRGTALAGGVMAAALMLPPSAALADDACNPSSGVIGTVTCSDGGNPDLSSYSFTASNNWHVYAQSGYTNNVTSGLSMFLISGTGVEAGNFTVYSGAHLDADPSNGSGAGIAVNGVSSTGITIEEDASVSDFWGVSAYGSNSGTFTLVNHGHLEGNGAAAGFVTGMGVSITNDSYGSAVGATSGWNLSNVHWVDYDNSHGLTVGYGNNGLDVVGVDGAGTVSGGPLVRVDNHAGVFSGHDDGVHIYNAFSTPDQARDIVINNDGYYDDPDTQTGFHQGGLIFGATGQGVDIQNTNNNVFINNDNTLLSSPYGVPYGVTDGISVVEGGSDLAALGYIYNSIASSTGGLLPTGVLPTGIIGETGIRLVDIGSNANGPAYANISNSNGLILGYDGNGVYANHVKGVFVDNTDTGGGDNSHFEGINYYGPNGVLLALDGDGLHYRDIDGNVNADNTGGLMIGVDSGADIRDVWRGDVAFNNAGGIIAGFDDGIRVSEVDSTYTNSRYYGGGVFIDNGDFQGGRFSDDSNYNPNWGGNGGLIIGGSRAISVYDAENVGIQNGADGWILGDGSWNDPVIRLNTNRYAQGGGGFGSYIYNNGVISSYDLPFEFNSQALSDFLSGMSPSDFELSDLKPALEQLLTSQKIIDDVRDISDYSWSGGHSGSIDNLSQYSDAANDLIVKSDGNRNNATEIVNDWDGVMIGRVDLDGRSADWDTGNSIENYGIWITHGRNTLRGSDNDYIENHGLIQTAQLGEAGGETSFTHLDDFYNGSYNSQGTIYSGAWGLISSIDGGAGDRTYISGNFHGTPQDDLGSWGTTSYIGVDTYFSADGSGGKSDTFTIGGDIDGSTGLIIKQVADQPSGYIYNNGWIPVVRVHGDDQNWNDSGNTCFGTLCKEGDTVFISSASQGYMNVGGYGAVQDGFNHAWYLTEWGNAPDPTFSLVAADAPNALQTPGIVTGAQNIFYDAGGVVSDHVYGSHFPLSGSGGADLPADTAYAGAGGSNNKTGLWAKITGNWDDQDSTVNQSILGTNVSIDTGFNQNTYSVLGGADFSPSGEANGFRAGIFGGYVSSSLDFTSYGASADYKGGVVGGYAAYTSGGFYVDTEVSADFLSIDYEAPAIGIGNTASVDGTTVGVIANTGYRFQNAWGFIEPIASLTYANTTVDNVKGGGSTVDFSNGESFRAGVGGRIGTSFGTPGGTRTEVSVLGKVWNEFEDANEVTITNNDTGDSATYSNDISGVFGEVSVTATTWTPGRAWSGFVTGGAKFSDAFTDWNGQLGVRRNF